MRVDSGVLSLLAAQSSSRVDGGDLSLLAAQSSSQVDGGDLSLQASRSSSRVLLDSATVWRGRHHVLPTIGYSLCQDCCRLIFVTLRWLRFFDRCLQGPGLVNLSVLVTKLGRFTKANVPAKPNLIL